jgi:hypothetical protein
VTPIAKQWAPGSVHVLEVPDVVLEGDRKVTFARWSNDGSRRQTFMASSEETVLMAHYQVWWRLDAISEGAQKGGVRAEGPVEDGYGCPARRSAW